MNKIELLAPAGNLEKLKFAYLYGADACYIGGRDFLLELMLKTLVLKKLMKHVVMLIILVRGFM